MSEISLQPRRTPEADLERSFRAQLADVEPPELEELAAFVDGALAPVEEEAFAARLVADPELSAEVRELEALRAELAAAGRLREGSEGESASRRFPRRYLAAAATLALALGSSWLATRVGRSERAPVGAPESATQAVVREVPAVSPEEALAESRPVAPLRASDRAPVGEAAATVMGFESGSLAGWQLPSTRLDFEGGRIDAPTSGSAAGSGA